MPREKYEMENGRGEASALKTMKKRCQL